MRLDQLHWTDVAGRAASSLLAVPVGSTEQHGPHLPISTDTDIAVALCDRLAGGRPDVLVAPAVAYGSAGEHAGFPGTLSIGAAVTEELLVELGRSADAFAGVLFVSAHGGNAAPVAAAVRRLVGESRRVRAWAPSLPAAATVATVGTVGTVGTAPPARSGSDVHAGFTETSVLLALHPAAVATGQAEAGPLEPLDVLLPQLRSRGVRAVSPNGVLGDPAGASSAEGEAILAEWTAALVAAVDGWP
ncbi:MAG TPA: mycofactocin biosynthesis peptidyl-dipeptidase MftE [Acidimicrobiales bacterium]|nr:mycofactocin biosynthesis peptidyl-dipeptidase MftE [Acidimicrobiales bacterium]